MRRLYGTFGAILLATFFASTGMAAEKIRNLCEIHYPSDQRIEWRCQKLKQTDTPQKLFGGHWLDVLRFNRMDRRHFFGGMRIKVPAHPQQIISFTPLPKTYPKAAQYAKLILIDQSEMFLGAYEHGKLKYSYPIAIGIQGYRVPRGWYQVDVADRHHKSNLYQVEEVGKPYPMHYGLRFWVDKSKDGWPSYWIHGRDVPGYPASHGCIGLYDEEMQVEYYAAYDKKVYKKYYHPLTKPYLQAAKIIYEWAIAPDSDPGTFHKIKNGPKVLVTGQPPQVPK